MVKIAPVPAYRWLPNSGIKLNVHFAFFQVLTFAMLSEPHTGAQMELTAPYGSQEEGS